jgi:hypothetical protein
MALPVTITGISTAIATVGPFKNSLTPITSESFTTLSSSYAIGNDTSHQAIGQTFTPSANYSISGVSLPIYRSGTVTDNVYVEIRDSTGSTVIATSSLVDGSTLGTSSGTFVDFAFSNVVSLSASTQYMLVMKRSGAPAATNFYFWTSTSSSNAGGDSYWYDGSTYTARSIDMAYKLYQEAYYFFGRDSTTSTTLQAYKSTSPDTSWSSIATSTGYATAVQAISGYQNGSTIHLAVMSGSSTSTNIHYQTFDMTSDTFPIKEVVQASFNPTDSAAATVFNCDIIFRTSDNQPIILYNGARVASMATSYARVVYARRTATNTWTTNVAVDAGGALDGYVSDCVMGASNSIHFGYKYPASTFVQRTLNSSNVLQTVSTGVATNTAGNVVGSSANISSVQKVAFTGVDSASSGNGVRNLYFDSGNTPTINTGGTSGVDAGTSGVGITAWDNGTLWILWVSTNNKIVYVSSSSNNGSTQTTGVAAFTGATSMGGGLNQDATIYQRGSSMVLPYIVNDNGTLKYNEYTVRTFGITGTTSITEADDTVASASTVKITAVNGGTDIAFLSQTNVGSDTQFGFGSSAAYYGETFIPTSNVLLTKIGLKMMKTGSPSDSVVMEIRDSTGTTVLGTSTTVAGSSLTTSRADASFTFSGGVALTGGTTYMFVIRRTGALDASNYYWVGYSISDTYANGMLFTYNSGTSSWDSGSAFQDIYFVLYQTNIVESDDTLSSASHNSTPNTANASITEANDTVSSVIQLTPIAGTASITEANDTSSGAAHIRQTFSTGFETGTTADLVAPGSTTVVTTHPRTGTYCLRLPTDNHGSTFSWSNPSSFGSKTSYGRMAVYVDQPSPALTVDQDFKLVSMESASNAIMSAYILLKADGTIWLDTNSTQTQITGWGYNQWACFEYFVQTGSPGVVTIRLNGTVIYTATPNYVSDNIGYQYGGSVGPNTSGYNVYYDNLAYDTDNWVGQDLATATASITEAGDTVSATSAMQIKGTASVTEAGDTVASTSTIALKAAASITEAGDTIAAPATIALKATTSVTEADDTIVAPATVALKASASITEASDSVSSTSAVAIKASLSNTEADDTISAAGTAVSGPVASASITEADDTVSAASTLATHATASITEAPDTISATSAIAIKASASNTEANDSISSTAGLAAKASLAITESGDSVSATSIAPIKANGKGYYRTNSGDLNFNWSGAVAVSGDKSIILAGAWVDTVGYPWISTNEGDTWTELNSNGLPSANWNAVASSNDGNLLVALPDSGTPYVSTNRGVTWTQPSPSTTGAWTSVTVSPNGGVIYAVQSGGVYVSTDVGATWNFTAIS